MFRQANKLISLLLFIGFFCFYLYRLPSLALIRWDELFWIEKSYFFELMIKGDFKNELWQSVFSYDQPKLGELMFGAYYYPQFLSYKKQIAKPDYQYWQFLIDRNFFESEWESLNPEYKQTYKNNNLDYIYWETDDTSKPTDYIAKYGTNFIPTHTMLMQARQLNALLLATSVVIVFLLGVIVGGKKIGLLAAVMYGTNPLVISAGLHAYSEALFLLLLNTGIFALMWRYSQSNKKNNHLILLGLLFGLCFSTKLVGIMLLCFFILFEALFLFLKKPKHISLYLSTFLHIGLVSVVTLALFIALNPFIYSNPFMKIQKMFAWRSSVVSDQYPYDTYQIADNYLARVTNVYWNFYGNERSVDFRLGANILPYTNIIVAILFLLGIVFMIKDYLHDKKQRIAIGIFLVIFVLLQFFAGIYLKLNYLRYFVHFVFFFNFIEVFGLYHSLRFLQKKIKILTRDKHT